MVEFFQSLPRKQHEVVWAAACELTQGLVERWSQEEEVGVAYKSPEQKGLYPGSWWVSGVLSPPQGGLGETVSEVELLEAVVVLCESTLACDTPTTPTQLRDTLQLLHGVCVCMHVRACVCVCMYMCACVGVCMRVCECLLECCYIDHGSMHFWGSHCMCTHTNTQISC